MSNQDFDDVPVRNAKDGEMIGPDAAQLIERGHTLQRVETPHTTAVTVQKPRNLDIVRKSVLMECQYAGKKFFYSWPVKNKKTGRKEFITGGSYHLAITILREFGNCAVIPSHVEEHPDRWVFHADAIDLERGFTVRRAFRKLRPKTSSAGNYDFERFEDMQFQLGQSKALRNAAFGLVPGWLIDEAVEESQKAEEAKINVDVGKARDNAIKYFEREGLDSSDMERLLNKTADKWNARDIATLRGFKQQIEDGYATAESLKKEANDEANVSAEDLLNAAKAKAQPASESPAPETPPDDAKEPEAKEASGDAAPEEMGENDKWLLSQIFDYREGPFKDACAKLKRAFSHSKTLIRESGGDDKIALEEQPTEVLEGCLDYMKKVVEEAARNKE